MARIGSEEPSALVVLKALRYGAIPVVRPLGANRDAVVDFDAPSETGTGIVLADETSAAWLDGLHRLLNLRAQDAPWRALQRNAMTQTFSWQVTGQYYRDLYRDVITHAAQ